MEKKSKTQPHSFDRHHKNERFVFQSSNDIFLEYINITHENFNS